MPMRKLSPREKAVESLVYRAATAKPSYKSVDNGLRTGRRREQEKTKRKKIDHWKSFKQSEVLGTGDSELLLRSFLD